MNLQTIDTKPGLLYSNKDINGNPSAWNAECPCSHLYKQVVVPGAVVRYEPLSSNLGYCAKYVSLSNGELIDSITGAVPYNFQVGGGMLDFGFTGAGSSVASGIRWQGESLSSGEIPSFSGDLSHEYPSGWAVIEPGASGHLPQNLVFYHKSGAPMDRGNSFSRATQRFPLKGRQPIRVGNTGLTYHPDNRDSGYAFKECLPALSMNTLSYEMGGGLVSVNVGAEDSNQIKYCGSAVTGSEWTLKLYSGEGVKITSVRLGTKPNTNMEDGDVFTVNNSAHGAASFSTQSITVEWEIDSSSIGTRALTDNSLMYGYGTFSTGSGSDPLVGSGAASWISGVPEIWQESTVSKYNCFRDGFGIGLVDYLEPTVNNGSTSGYATRAQATLNFYSDRGAGGTFRFSGASETLESNYFQFIPTGNIGFELVPGYCSRIAGFGLGPINKVLSTGDSGYYFKSGSSFTIISNASGTGNWNKQKINGHAFKVGVDDCPQFSSINWVGDPTGSMIGGAEPFASQYPYQSNIGSGGIIGDLSTARVYSSVEGGVAGITSVSGIFINIKNQLVDSQRQGYGTNRFNNESDNYANEQTLSAGIYNSPSNINSKAWSAVQTITSTLPNSEDPTSPTNILKYTGRSIDRDVVIFRSGPTGLISAGGLAGGPIDIDPMFSGSLVTRDNVYGAGTGGYYNFPRGAYWRNGYSGYNQAYKGINIKPYKLEPTGLLSITDNMSQVDQSLYLATGDTFGFTFNGTDSAETDGLVALGTAGTSTINILLEPRSQTEWHGDVVPVSSNPSNIIYNVSEDGEPNSASGISMGLTNYNILGPEDDFWGDYLGYSYYAIVGVALGSRATYEGESPATRRYLGSWGKFFVNPPWKRSSSVLPWGHSEDISTDIDDFCSGNSLYLVQKSSQLTSPIDLHGISVSGCQSAREEANGAGLNSTELGLYFLVGSFWAYGGQSGGLDFPGFPTHDSNPLVTGARPFYKPWWGGNG